MRVRRLSFLWKFMKTMTVIKLRLTFCGKYMRSNCRQWNIRLAYTRRTGLIICRCVQNEQNNFSKRSSNAHIFIRFCVQQAKLCGCVSPLEECMHNCTCRRSWCIAICHPRPGAEIKTACRMMIYDNGDACRVPSVNRCTNWLLRYCRVVVRMVWECVGQDSVADNLVQSRRDPPARARRATRITSNNVFWSVSSCIVLTCAE